MVNAAVFTANFEDGLQLLPLIVAMPFLPCGSLGNPMSDEACDQSNRILQEIIMSISGITSSSYYQSNLQSPSLPKASNFKSLVQSLQNGDLSGAQQAYAALQQFFSTSTSSTSASPTGQTSPISADFQTLGKALQSGDLSSAQQALAKLQQDGQSAIQAHGGHHHHHHAAGAGGNQQSQTAQVSPPAQSGSSIDVNA